MKKIINTTEVKCASHHFQKEGSAESACNVGRPRFDPWVGKIPWQSTPVFFPGEFHGQKSLAGYSAWDCKESDTTEQLTHTKLYYLFCCSDYSRFVHRKYIQVGFSVPLTCLFLSVFLSISLLPGTARGSRFILYFPVVKEHSWQWGDTGDSSLSSGSEDPLDGAWQPTPVLLSGEFHGQRSLASHSPWGYKKSWWSTHTSVCPRIKDLPWNFGSCLYVDPWFWPVSFSLYLKNFFF